MGNSSSSPGNSAVATTEVSPSAVKDLPLRTRKSESLKISSSGPRKKAIPVRETAGWSTTTTKSRSRSPSAVERRSRDDPRLGCFVCAHPFEIDEAALLRDLDVSAEAAMTKRRLPYTCRECFACTCCATCIIQHRYQKCRLYESCDDHIVVLCPACQEPGFDIHTMKPNRSVCTMLSSLQSQSSSLPPPAEPVSYTSSPSSSAAAAAASRSSSSSAFARAGRTLTVAPKPATTTPSTSVLLLSSAAAASSSRPAKRHRLSEEDDAAVAAVLPVKTPNNNSNNNMNILDSVRRKVRTEQKLLEACKKKRRQEQKLLESIQRKQKRALAAVEEAQQQYDLLLQQLQLQSQQPTTPLGPSPPLSPQQNNIEPPLPGLLLPSDQIKFPVGTTLKKRIRTKWFEGEVTGINILPLYQIQLTGGGMIELNEREMPKRVVVINNSKTPKNQKPDETDNVNMEDEEVLEKQPTLEVPKNKWYKKANLEEEEEPINQPSAAEERTSVVRNSMGPVSFIGSRPGWDIPVETKGTPEQYPVSAQRQQTKETSHGNNHHLSVSDRKIKKTSKKASARGNAMIAPSRGEPSVDAVMAEDLDADDDDDEGNIADGVDDDDVDNDRKETNQGEKRDHNPGGDSDSESTESAEDDDEDYCEHTRSSKVVPRSDSLGSFTNRRRKRIAASVQKKRRKQKRYESVCTPTDFPLQKTPDDFENWKNKIDELLLLPQRFIDVVQLMDVLFPSDTGVTLKHYFFQWRDAEPMKVMLRELQKKDPDNPAISWHRPNFEWVPTDKESLKKFIPLLFDLAKQKSTEDTETSLISLREKKKRPQKKLKNLPIKFANWRSRFDEVLKVGDKLPYRFKGVLQFMDRLFGDWDGDVFTSRLFFLSDTDTVIKIKLREFQIEHPDHPAVSWHKFNKNWSPPTRTALEHFIALIVEIQGYDPNSFTQDEDDKSQEDSHVSLGEKSSSPRCDWKYTLRRIIATNGMPLSFQAVVRLLDVLFEIKDGSTFGKLLYPGIDETTKQKLREFKTMHPNHPAVCWHGYRCEWCPPDLESLEHFIAVVLDILNVQYQEKNVSQGNNANVPSAAVSEEQDESFDASMSLIQLQATVIDECTTSGNQKPRKIFLERSKQPTPHTLETNFSDPAAAENLQFALKLSQNDGL